MALKWREQIKEFVSELGLKDCGDHWQLDAQMCLAMFSNDLQEVGRKGKLTWYDAHDMLRRLEVYLGVCDGSLGSPLSLQDLGLGLTQQEVDEVRRGIGVRVGENHVVVPKGFTFAGLAEHAVAKNASRRAIGEAVKLLQGLDEIVWDETSRHG